MHHGGTLNRGGGGKDGRTGARGRRGPSYFIIIAAEGNAAYERRGGGQTDDQHGSFECFHSDECSHPLIAPPVPAGCMDDSISDAGKVSIFTDTVIPA